MNKEEKVNINMLQQSENMIESKSESVSEAFIKAHMYIINSITSSVIRKRMMPTCIEHNDLINWGIEGLIEAYKNFNENKGAQFKTYAYIRVRGTILDKIKSEWEYRDPSQFNKKNKEVKDKLKAMVLDSQKIKLTQDKLNVENTIIENTVAAYLFSYDPALIEIESEKQGTQNPEVEHVDKSESVLWEEINKLDDDEKNIINLFYVTGLKQKEISERLQFSRSKVSRIHSNVLLKLKKRLNIKYHA